VKTHFSFSLTVAESDYEVALALLYRAGMSGCEEVTITSGGTTLTAYFSSVDSARDALQSLPPALSLVNDCIITPVEQLDWNAKWRESMKPALLAEGWWVSPVWLPPNMETGDHWIKIEPKMAFGTGHHESTRLAAQALISGTVPVKNASILDIGTGSGVLCFTAAQCGAARCTGVEIDGDCRENLAENRELNSVATPCRFIIGGIDALSSTAAFDIIIMNMIHTESAPLLYRCRSLAAHNGHLVWSGILADEYTAAVDAARDAGFTLCSQFIENEWWCGTFSVTAA